MIRIRSRRRRGNDRRRLLFERLGDRRVLAAITGTVFDDADDSFRQEASETALADRLIYLDHNANGAIDSDEPRTLTDADGRFSFPELAPGSYLLRLFDGSTTQSPTFPVEAVASDAPIPAASAHQVLSSDAGSTALATDRLVVGNFESGTGTDITFGSSLSKMQPLPGGDLLVIGGDGRGESAWRVDPDSGTASPADLSGDDGTASGSTVAWSDLALDGQGRGLLLEASDEGAVAVHSIDASDPDATIGVTDTSYTAAAEARAIASASGPRSVIAWPGDQGLSVALWSNVTASPIGASGDGSGEPSLSDAAVELSTASELLAFDDDSGLLVVRNLDGGVTIHDADAEFAALLALPEVTGPVALDAARDLLLSVSPVDSALKLIDLRDGSLVADQALDLSSIGAVAAMAPGHRADSVVVLGAAGMTEVALQRQSARAVTLSGESSAAVADFGVRLSGSNTPPSYEAAPALTIAEDAVLDVAAPDALAGSQDADGDALVLLSAGPATHGSAVVSADGGLRYEPDPDFAGTERLMVALHDGRGMTEVTLEITVTPVPDAPSAVNLNIPAVSEHVEPGTVIGTYEVVDADAQNDHQVSLSDPRLRAEGGQIFFDSGSLNYEQQWQFPMGVTVADPEAGAEVSEQTIVEVADADDPITGIQPETVYAVENAPGDVIAELVVEDEDAEPVHVITVDDERFVVEFSELRLADGIALDHEAESTVTVQVTASDPTSGDRFTQEITIHVQDLPEQAETIELGGDSVIEFEPGAVVGEVTVDGQPAADNYTLSVDDSRFEIADDGSLKLFDRVWVERAYQSEIQVEITAEDAQQQHDPITETFIIEVVENNKPYHNDELPQDVNDDDRVTAADALAVINYLNAYGPGPVGHGDPGFFYDVNGDGMVSALDVLLVVNTLHRNRSGGEAGEGEMLPADAPQLADDSNAPPEPSDAEPTDAALAEFDRPPRRVDRGGSDNGDSSPSSLEPADHAAADESRESYAAKVDQTLRLLSERTS